MEKVQLEGLWIGPNAISNGLICVNIPMLGALSVNILQGPATPNFER